MNGHRAGNSGGVTADQHASLHPFHTGLRVSSARDDITQPGGGGVTGADPEPVRLNSN